MGRKVFISFLGTTNYTECHYELDGKRSVATKFIQEALIDFLCDNWSENDEIIIFGTGKDSGSIKKNWFDGGQSTNSNGPLNRGLQNILKLKNIKAKLNDITEIPEGFSEKEIWEIFDTVYNKLKEEDEIYFDVTHAFRSIPMFSTVLFNLSHFLKKTNLISVYYGAFEKLGPSYKVKEMKIEERIAPIINLTEIIRLQEMTSAASNFIEYGRIKDISNIISFSGDRPGTIMTIKNEIDKLDGYILTNRMNDIKEGKFVEKIQSNLKKVRKQNIPTAEKLILDRLEEELKNFVPEESNQNIEAAIQWAFKYNMLAQAYTLAQEYIISLTFNELKNRNPYENNKDGIKKYRQYLSSILGIDDEDIKQKKYDGQIKEKEELSQDLLNINWITELRKEYKILADNRNNINHAKGEISAKHLSQQFQTSYEKCKHIFENLDR